MRDISQMLFVIPLIVVLVICWCKSGADDEIWCLYMCTKSAALEWYVYQ